MARKGMFLMLFLCVFVFAGCGSSSTTVDEGTNGSQNQSGNANPTPVSADSEAIAGSVFDVSATSSVSSADSGTAQTAKGYAENGFDENQLQKSVAKYVTQIVADELLDELEYGGNEKVVVSQNSSTLTVTFQNDQITMGSGNIVLNGSFTFTQTNADSYETRSDISVTINNMTDTLEIGDQTYAETVNGTVHLSFTGSFNVQYDNSHTVTAIQLNWTVAITGQDLRVTGTVDGDVSTMNVGFGMSGDLINPSTLQYTCSGTIDVVAPSGAQRCIVKSDCSGCSN
ncbi:MAG: hypothetical protein COS89_07035 [Deltaproteobacteria bacterium CG07_land_8_20_14_0_80_38_7]|nr:MAG: hypothetical protein COS89_07035 [Deltaproteobacteria bacterium CG07_land_8_20_14_0_80_38_7]